MGVGRLVRRLQRHCDLLFQLLNAGRSQPTLIGFGMLGEEVKGIVKQAIDLWFKLLKDKSVSIGRPKGALVRGRKGIMHQAIDLLFKLLPESASPPSCACPCPALQGRRWRSCGACLAPRPTTSLLRQASWR